MRNLLTKIPYQGQEIKVRLFLYILASCSLLISLQLSSLSIGLVALHALATTKRKEAKQALQRNKKPLILYLAFFALFLISLLYTNNLKLGWKDIESKLSFIVLPIAILSQPRLKKLELKTVLKVFSSLTLSFGLLAVLMGFLKEGKLLTNQELSAQVGIHASYLSLYLILALATFISEAIKGRRYRLLYFGISLLGFVILLLLASRIIILSTFLIAGIYIFFFNFSKGKLFVLLFSIIALFITIYAVPSVNTRFVEAVDFSDRIELDAPLKEHRTLGRNFGGRAIRVAIWTCSMDVVEENWLFGVGAGDVHQHLQQSYKDHVFEFAYKHNNYNAHNLFIESLIAVGILGLLLVLAMFTLLLKEAFLQKNLIYLTFALSFFMLSIMESSFNVHRGLVFFLLFALVFQNSTGDIGIKKVRSESSRSIKI